ncbi:hypothetical protein [Oculatella sp. FACHB-28]|uniref:WD40 repeat domain-containing protein n=1 Tax=Oculatella sp. FACHB-28 TaxID=2692845 RepID=UPI00321FA553
MIVSSDDKGFINIWAQQGQLLGRIKAPENYVFYAEFSPDDKFIASTNFSQSIKIWDVAEVIETWRNKGEPETRYREIVSPGSVDRISFIPNPTRLGTSSLVFSSADQDGNIRIWEIEKSEAVNEKFQPTLDNLMLLGCQILHNYSSTSPEIIEEDLPFCLRN